MRALSLVFVPILLSGQVASSDPRNRHQQTDKSGAVQDSANPVENSPLFPPQATPADGRVNQPSANPRANATDPEPQSIWQKAFAPETT
jgi:hypothetical protein